MRAAADTTILVTGATSGHGLGLARLLARQGAALVLLGRSPERLAAVERELTGLGPTPPRTIVCDLARRADVDRAADDLLADDRPLHALVNNAGIVNQRRELTPDGIESTFAVNVLAAYQLTARLLPRLRQSAPARVVIVSSDMHRIARLDLDDLEMRRGYSWWMAYGRSKLALVVMARELARRLQGTGVTVNAMDPGPVSSRIAQNNPSVVARLATAAVARLFPAPEKAARMAAALALAPAYAGVTGGYFRFGAERTPSVPADEGWVAARLLGECARMTGVPLPPP